MTSQFQIHVNAIPEMLQKPPPQFANPRLMYTPLCVEVGGLTFPASVWCDVTGVLLLDWCREVWKLSSGESRAARMVFTDTPNGIWIRRTAMRWWKVSCMTWSGKTKTPVHEILIVPEQVEAALLTACRKLLSLAREAGVWSKDCAAIEHFLTMQRAVLVPE
ncbi:MAG: hypothetical protein L0Y70_23130 [Gemmataceae bacterium]|nr:hypothetical protein [Gemmataceae bacterium]